MAGPWTKMVSMELTEEEKLEDCMPCPPSIGNQPDYPYGLRISLTERELDKLGLEEDPEIGDYIDLRAFACVTSASREQSANGPRRRIELTIERLAIEDEDREEMGGGEDERAE